MTRSGPGRNTTDDSAALAALQRRYPSDAWELLGPRLSPTRRARLEAVVAQRTRHIRLVVQDVHQSHNISACMRSADAFGVQEVDVVTLRSRFRVSSVARGVAHWLTFERHRSVENCITRLRAQGYKLAAGLPRPDARPVYELPVDEPIAVIFGNEHAGIDPAWLEHVDYPFTIPMVGMVESLNISVSCAITLAHLTRAAHAALPSSRYFLAESDRAQLLCDWICKTIPSWELELERARQGRPD